MTRRDYGSVRRLPSGRWQARYATPTGGRTTAPETFTTRAFAAAYLARIQADLDRGAWVDPVASVQSFGEYATAWFGDRADLRPRTVELYTGLLARHLVPQLGDVPLVRVTTTWCASGTPPGSGPASGRSTVAKAYRLLKTILNIAVADEVLAHNL